MKLSELGYLGLTLAPQAATAPTAGKTLATNTRTVATALQTRAASLLAPTAPVKTLTVSRGIVIPPPGGAAPASSGGGMVTFDPLNLGPAGGGSPAPAATGWISCLPGTHPNAAGNGCIADAPPPIAMRRPPGAVPALVVAPLQCARGTHPNAAGTACVADVVNPPVCMAGEELNAAGTACVKKAAITSGDSTVMTTEECPGGSYKDSSGKCVVQGRAELPPGERPVMTQDTGSGSSGGGGGGGGGGDSGQYSYDAPITPGSADPVKLMTDTNTQSKTAAPSTPTSPILYVLGALGVGALGYIAYKSSKK